MKTIIISATSDLVTDQRLIKIGSTLQNAGTNVLLLGRGKRSSIKLSIPNINSKRFVMFAERGPFFYAEFNLRLFCYLLTAKVDILVSNDLDTLLANYLVAKIRRKKLFYDSHEYFLGVPELDGRRVVKTVWTIIERVIFPRLTHAYTVNSTIAGIYSAKYNQEVAVIRNLPLQIANAGKFSKKELSIPEGKKVIIMQGTGINVDRGAEEAIEAMQYIENAVLLMIGGGDVWNRLKQITSRLKLVEKVRFVERVSFEKLMNYTQYADVGLTLDKGTNENYKYSLPNKLFDYIQAGVPVLTSPIVEIMKVFKKYDIGEIIDSHDAKHIADKINHMLSDLKKRQEWKGNLKDAANEFCWEKESAKLLKLYENELMEK